MKVPKSHPRYLSLITRDRIVKGVEKGVTSIHGLIAQGRGEAFDYLIGERTNEYAKKAIDAAACLLLTSKHPVISVNGNVCALAAKEIVKLSKVIPAKMEINIFHSSPKREKLIAKELRKAGAKEVLLPSKKFNIKHIDHNRKYVNKNGILIADVVLVPLEDGDRCQALIKNGKKVIAIDLNPKSRTSQKATITIVDNITRAIRLLIDEIGQMKKKDVAYLRKQIKNYNNQKILKEAIASIKTNF